MPPRRRQATADDLLTKRARTQELAITVPGDKGDDQLIVSLTSISSTAYDQLLAEHPPTKDQLKEGNTYNPDTFAPALISEVMSEPKLTVEQATAIWKGETWNRGELRDLFMGCVNLCQRGLDIPFMPAD